MNKPKYDFSKENPYNTFGKDNFLNANTGEEVRMVNEDWRTISQKGGLSFAETKMTLNDQFDFYIKRIPNDLSLVTNDLFVNQDPLENLKKEDLYDINLGSLKNIFEFFQEKNLLEAVEEIDPDPYYTLYNKLPLHFSFKSIPDDYLTQEAIELKNKKEIIHKDNLRRLYRDFQFDSFEKIVEALT